MPDVVLRAALLSLLLLVLGSAPASAHAALVSTNPEDGSSLGTAPSTITLTFNENIRTPAYVAVTAPDGTQVRTPRVTAVDATVTADVSDVDKRGRYSASYRVVSADGHPVEGTVHYTVTTGRTVKQVETPAQSSFVHRHGGHILWGTLAAVVALGLLLVPLRRRHDSHGS